MRYAFCPTEELYREAIKQSSEPLAEYPLSPGCCVAYDHIFHDGGRERRCVIILQEDILLGDSNVLMGILVHECVHAVQFLLRSMDDYGASDEFYAYATQAIFVDLLGDVSIYLTKLKKEKGIT